MTDHAKAFTATMEEAARDLAVRPWEVFGDWCEMAYCTLAALSQAPARRERYEERYMKLAGRYRGNLDKFTKMLGQTTLALQADERRDFLGTIYEASGFSVRKYGGQFWTPTQLAEVMARISMTDGDRTTEIITVADPCCGSGRLLLAACKVLEENGVVVAERVWTDSTDIDAVCAQITYVQLSLAGVPGIVRHADTLSGETYDWAITPAGVRLYSASQALRSWLDGGGERTEAGAAPPKALAPPPAGQPVQIDMFG